MEKKINTIIGRLEELEEEEWESENFLFETDEEHQVWLDKNHLVIRGLGLQIHSGVWYENMKMMRRTALNRILIFICFLMPVQRSICTWNREVP